jgi:hypothetical protein
LNTELHSYKAGTPSLEPHLQSILLWLLFRDRGLTNELFAQASLLISASQVARIAGMSHWPREGGFFGYCFQFWGLN